MIYLYNATGDILHSLEDEHSSASNTAIMQEYKQKDSAVRFASITGIGAFYFRDTTPYRDVFPHGPTHGVIPDEARDPEGLFPK